MGGARVYGFEGPKKDRVGSTTNEGRINVKVLEDEQAVWCDCVDRSIAGEREMSLIRDLNERGTPSPLGASGASATCGTCLSASAMSRLTLRATPSAARA